MPLRRTHSVQCESLELEGETPHTQKHSGSSSPGPRFDPQRPHGGLQLSVTPVSEDLTPSFGFWLPDQAHRRYRNMHAAKTLINIKFKRKKE